MKQGLRVFPNGNAREWAERNQNNYGFHYDLNCGESSVFIWSAGIDNHNLQKRLEDDKIHCIQSMKLL